MLHPMNAVTQAVQGKFHVLGPLLDERGRRLWAAAEARAIGHGGITRVAEATGMSRGTVRAGVRELDSATPRAPRAGGARVRAPGGGRKALTDRDPGLVKALEDLLDPFTRGDPQGPLRWTCSSAARLAEQLGAQGHRVSERTVNRLLHELGYRLQANRRGLEGRQHPDRDAQFRRIARRARAFQRLGQPVASIYTRKKELVGRYRDGGREWHPKGRPEEVRVHDFIDRDPGKAVPCGGCDLTANSSWVRVGVDHDTAEFAVETVRRWWRQMGCHAYPAATRLLLTADWGGSNSRRSRQWRFELQQLADALRLRISVCHFPLGTSKWTEVEQRMFCHVTESWRGRALVSHEVVVNVIGGTTAKGGLAIGSELDATDYPTGREVMDEPMGRLSIRRDAFHGEWNYSLLPDPTVEG